MNSPITSNDQNATDSKSREIAEIDPSEPIRQGDIFVWVGKNNPQIGRIICIVTADCDFAQKKTGNTCLAVPIARASDYLSTTWVHKTAQTELDKQLKILRDEIIAHPKSAEDDSGSKITEEALVITLRSGRVETTLNKILSKKPTDSQISRAKYIKQLIYRLAQKRTITLSEYVKFQAAFENKTENETLLKLQKNINSKGKSLLPDDVFFVENIPYSGSGESGFIAQLRHPREIRLPSLLTSVQEARRRGNAYARSGRLNHNFKYALSQSFGNLFSRIGLPKDYDDSKANCISTINIKLG